MYQSHVYPDSPLTYGGSNVAKEEASPERGDNTWHPTNFYTSGNAKMHHQTHGPKQLVKANRVLLWDIDQTWSFDPDPQSGSFNYKGAHFNNDNVNYLDGFKNILYNDRMTDTKFEFNYFADGWNNSGTIQDLTRWGASDGTSRTNAHAVSCWVRHSSTTDASLALN